MFIHVYLIQTLIRLVLHAGKIPDYFLSCFRHIEIFPARFYLQDAFVLYFPLKLKFQNYFLTFQFFAVILDFINQNPLENIGMYSTFN